MSETSKEKEASPAGGDDEGGAINDPLTHSDVEAPRVPFESGPEPEE